MPNNARNGAPNSKRPARRANPGAKPRSRAGCVTCKVKHVKCDETVPACLTCTRKGLKCEYRRGELKWSYKHQPMTSESFSVYQPEEDATSLDVVDIEPAPPPPFELSPSQGEDAFLRLMDSCNARQDLPDDPAAFLPPAASWGSTPSLDLENLEHDAISSNLDAERYLARASTLASGPDATVALMANWFDKVCPAWSGFDSAMNMNRKLAEDLWHNSAAVFNSLQSMSASFLSARLPYMRQFALSLMKTATLCIQAEVAAIRRQSHLDTVPTGLLFSLFCLGTTVCWLDASRLGRPFMNEAKYILRRLGQQRTASNNDDREVIMFFKKSLVYWEMLLAVADDPQEEVDDSAPDHQMWPSGQDATVDNLPHPWTGISALTSHLFSRSIKLCRAYRYESMARRGGARNFLTPMDYFEEAQRLEEQLLELEFSSFAPVNDTGDDKTPWFHLAHVAEAYQLSSLLQLYETFPGLVSLRLPLDSILSDDGQVPWERWIIPLSLRLTEVLEHIPPDSGSRVIQPLLYICASTGLRYSLSDSPAMLHPSRQMAGQDTGLRPGHGRADSDLLDYIGQIDTVDSPEMDPPPVSQTALDICKGRDFIMSRLNSLERSLQPKPVIVARELVKAIWVAYDNETPGSTPIHWIDVMENKELRSLFG